MDGCRVLSWTTHQLSAPDSDRKILQAKRFVEAAALGMVITRLCA